MSDNYFKPDFEQIFDDALRESRSDGPRSRLFASDLSAGLDDGCERQLFHKLANDDRKDRTVGELMRFRAGNRIHEDVASMIEQHSPDDWHVAGIEEYGNELPGVSCRVDMRMIDPDGLHVVLEVKTSRGRAFSYRNGIDDVREAHKLQLRTGIEATRSDYGVLLYIDREGSNKPDSFIIEPNSDQVHSIIDQLEELIGPANRYHYAKKAVEHGLIDEDEVPEPPEPLDPEIVRNENKGADSIEVNQPWLCNYCDFQGEVCPGAVPDELLADGVVAKDKEDGLVIYNDKIDEKHLDDLRSMIREYE